jgi:hypothetical protein
MEPQWTKKISSTTICTTYNYIFYVYALISIISFIGTIGILLSFKLPKGLSVSIGFQGLLITVLGTVMTLFQYLVCTRALLQTK